MKRRSVLIAFVLFIPFGANAADLSTASAEDLIGVYRQLRAISAGNETAVVENVVFKRDAATCRMCASDNSLHFSPAGGSFGRRSGFLQ